MKLTFSSRRPPGGFSLMAVLLMTALALLILGGVMDWVSNTGRQSAKREEYYSSLAAADAAIEKVISTMALDFQAAAERSDFQGADLTPLDANLATYQGQFASTELSGVADYEFTAPTIGADATYVSKIADRAWVPLTWKYEGFGGQAASFRVVSNARNTNSSNGIVSALRQDVQFASIPVFEFALFYGSGMDLELNPAHESFTISGPVHANANLYCEPHTFTVTFGDAVTACGIITNAPSPLDPTTRTPGPVNFNSHRDMGVAPLYLPIGMNNTPANLRQIIEIPPTGESPTSVLGLSRFYNRADLIILVTNDSVLYIAGGSTYTDNNLTNLWWGTNVLTIDGGTNFYNIRENGASTPWVQFTEVNVGQIPLGSNNITAMVGHVPTNIYIADFRTLGAGTKQGIRLVNASDLSGFPAAGLTIATQDPLYVKGSFNAVAPKPAALVADAVFVLSAGWNDANGSAVLGSRVASADLSINAGVLAGVTQSDGSDYSGGVENFFRLIEDWTGRQLSFTGSIVVLFPSQVAAAPWKEPPANTYLPPNRNFSYDVNFKNPATLPPGTPHVRTIIRQERAITQADSTL